LRGSRRCLLCREEVFAYVNIGGSDVPLCKRHYRRVLGLLEGAAEREGAGDLSKVRLRGRSLRYA